MIKVCRNHIAVIYASRTREPTSMLETDHIRVLRYERISSFGKEGLDGTGILGSVEESPTVVVFGLSLRPQTYLESDSTLS